MRCKPGDCALVLRGVNAKSMHAGKIVDVLALRHANSIYGPVWTIRFRSEVAIAVVNKSGSTVGLGGFGRTTGCPDAWLKPLRDPGDAAIDETLLHTPVPTLETA